MIRFSPPLVEAKLIRRYKRFLADAELMDGSIVTAHCPNTGSMKTCGSSGDRIYLRPTPEPHKKLKYCWEYTAAPAGLIGINTANANHIVEDGLKLGLIEPLSGYVHIKREARYDQHTRFDFLLSGHYQQRADCYLEVKNVTLFQKGRHRFPDAVSERGQKHLTCLIDAARQGYRAVLLFLINRPEIGPFEPAADIDEIYARKLEESLKSGVEILLCQTENTLASSAISKGSTQSFGITTGACHTLS